MREPCVWPYGTQDELNVEELLAQGRNDCVEFKASIRWDHEKNAVSRRVEEAPAIAIAGMLNSMGGTLLIGVDDTGTVLGIESDVRTLRRKTSDGFQLLLTDIARRYLGMEYMAYIRIDFAFMDQKQVCIVSINKSPTPVFFAHGDFHTFWTRAGISTRSLKVKEALNYIQANWEEAR